MRPAPLGRGSLSPVPRLVSARRPASMPNSRHVSCHTSDHHAGALSGGPRSAVCVMARRVRAGGEQPTSRRSGPGSVEALCIDSVRGSVQHESRSTSVLTAVFDNARLLTVDEVGALLRVSRKAVYALIERRQLPGVRRIGRRVRFDRRELLDWLDHTCAPSPKEKRR
jgi:excisionase family DNA binding protein